MDFNAFLKSLIAVGRGGVSDIHFKVGSPPLLRVAGKLYQAKFPKLDPEQTKTIAANLLGPDGAERIAGVQDYDGSYQIPDAERLRVNIFLQRGHYSIVLRVIPVSIPSFDDLNLPEVLKQIAVEPRGLVLVTGITGSGKSTTLAAMIDHINGSISKHILTVEDPIEFLHTDKRSSINQREIGTDSEDFASALRAGLRQDPDIILVGEIRDVPTVNTAIKAAETGHVVFSTLHTVDAMSTINRILDMYPAEQNQQLRIQLAANLKATISQRLVTCTDGRTVVPVVEVMRVTSTIREYIEKPENTHKIKDAIEAGRSQYAMQTFDQHLTELYQRKLIDLDTAMAAASSPSDFQRSLHFE
jgi:twitching motility protein PilT